MDPNYVKAERQTQEKQKDQNEDKKSRQSSAGNEKSENQNALLLQPFVRILELKYSFLRNFHIILRKIQPPPATPNQFLDPLKRPLRFVIQNGFAKSGTSEYQAFKQFYCLHWGKYD